MNEPHASPLPHVLEPAALPEFPPLEQQVIVTMPNGTEFLAMRVWVEDGQGGCSAWATADEYEPLAPECWCDGICWASNSHGVESVQPVAWRPINHAS